MPARSEAHDVAPTGSSNHREASPTSLEVPMRSHLVACATFLSIAVGAPVAALATGAGHIAVNQQIRRSLGACHYEVTLRGSYNARAAVGDNTPIENAF